MDVVFARHEEPLHWAGYLSRLPGVRVFVYNDGAPMEDGVAFKGFRIRAGDGRPAESGKYLRHIIDHYDDLAEFTVLLQADPFEHSPDLIGLLGRRDLWEPVQNLTYRYSWKYGPQQFLVDESDGVSSKFIGGFRACEDRMDPDLQGLRWKEPFCSRMRFSMHDEDCTIVERLSKKFGFSPSTTLRKSRAACFAVRRDIIRKHPRRFYENILEWFLSPDEIDDVLAAPFPNTAGIIKSRAILLEFMWLCMLDADPAEPAPPPPPRSPPPPPSEGPMARLLRRRAAYAEAAYASAAPVLPSSPPSSSASDTRVASVPVSLSSPSEESPSSYESLSMKLPMLLPESSDAPTSESPPESSDPREELSSSSVWSSSGASCGV